MFAFDDTLKAITRFLLGNGRPNPKNRDECAVSGLETGISLRTLEV